MNNYLPYAIKDLALKLIAESTENNFSRERELQIVLLLNKSEDNYRMSHYQLARAHKTFAEFYNSIGMTGSALEHYEKALELDNKLAVKRILTNLKKIPKDELVYGIDINTYGEPDLSELNTEVYDPSSEYTTEHKSKYIHKYITDKEMVAEDDIYDPEWERMIEERLDKLDEISKKEFYRHRALRDINDVNHTYKELDMFMLKSMEESSAYYKEKEERESKNRIEKKE